MSYAIISDVHANLHALEAVLVDIKARGIHEVHFGGDAVGYGPKPNECIRLLKAECKTLIAGNHDWALIGYTDIEYFNRYAAAAILWSRGVVTQEHFGDLTALKILKSLEEHDALLVHSTPLEPENWNYLFSPDDLEKNFLHFTQKICFVGHSHFPVIVEKQADGELSGYKNRIEFNDSCRYIINVGSVGQPRDHDPRAAYAVLDDNAVEIVRVEYDFKKTQKEMTDAGLPDKLIDRLSHGV
jgi:diadenosine tetraphosphatase ApaH/serine/threonine PP2A family protein phosphatase